MSLGNKIFEFQANAYYLNISGNRNPFLISKSYFTMFILINSKLLVV